MPAGSVVEPLWRGELTVAGRTVAATGADLGGLGAGMVTVTDGRAPRSPGEVAVSEPLAEAAGLAVGDTTATGVGRLDVTGIVRVPLELDRQAIVVAPAAAPATSGVLVGLPGDGDPTAVARALERQGWDVTTAADVTATDPEQLLFVLLLGGFALLVAGLVAGAAFAVSAQRRRHELALLAAAGAGPAQLRWSVLSGALLLGATGALAGVVLGLAGAAATLPWLEVWANRAVDGPVIDVVPVAAAGVAGIAAATAGAWLTACSVARTPVDAALTGRRPPRTSGRRLLVGGAASVVVGMAVMLATAAAASNAGTSELVTALGLLTGAAAVMVGLGAMSPWIIDGLAGTLGSGLPVGARLALRDVARFRSRTGPIVMAIVAGLGLAIAVGATLRTIETGIAHSYVPQLADDQLLVDGSAPQPVVEELDDELDVTAAAPFTITQPVDRDRTRALPPVVAVADGRLLDAVAAPAGARAALEAGRVVVLTDGRPGPDPTAQAEALAPDGIETATMEQVPGAVPPVVLTADTFERSGVAPARAGTRWLVRTGSPVTDARARAAQQVAGRFGQRVTVESGPPHIAAGAIRAVTLAGAGGLALLVVGIGLALIAAETRAADDTLVAVGAPPRARRTLAAARAAVLTAVGGVLAVPAGLVPVWGLTGATDAGAATRLAVPWDAVGLTVLVMPVLAAGAAWLAARPARTTLSARAG